jgi:type IV pilus assembly protein PilY1
MNNTMPTNPPLWRRAVAFFLALTIAGGPLATPAFAQTLLADEPIAFVPRAEPNIVMTVDDSTSMLSDFLPDYIIGPVPNAGTPGFCRDSTGAMNRACGFIGSATSPPHIYQQTNFPFPTYASGYTNSGIPDWISAWPAPMHSNALNRAYYDPSQTYLPPLKADGTPYPNQTTYTAVPADPWAATVKNVNLTANVSVPLFCNSDWPLDTNWDPASGWGNHCRINGVDYSQAFQVAKAKNEYQYPWRNVSGQPNHVQHYWRHNFTKTLYCDPKSAAWPQNCTTTTTYTCKTGTYIPPVAKSYPQTCVAGAVTKACDTTKNSDFTPAGCQKSLLHAPPGLCTKGSECLPCSCSNPSKVTGQSGTCKAAKAGDPNSNANCGCTGAGCALKACANHNVPGTGVGTCSDKSAPVPTTKTTCNKAGASCGAVLWDTVANKASTTTMLADANGAGVVCRHNNQSYSGGPVAAPFNYPDAKYTQAVTSGCAGVPANAAVKRHYWKTSIEWCSTALPLNHPSIWRGYGDPSDCKDDRDATYKWPRFYKWGVPKTDAAYADNIAHAAFEKVDLDPTKSYTHTFFRNGQWRTITRNAPGSGDPRFDEMANYANWFAYYRTRIQAAKTVISQNFTFLDDEFRVGFHTLSNVPATSFVDVQPFSPAQKNDWYNELFGIKIPMGNNTPNMEAIVRVGEWFKNGSSATLSGASDPIVLSCQRNFHMLFTDGAQNQPAASAPLAGDRDDKIGIPYNLTNAVPALINGQDWPNLYRQNPLSPMADTLADFAMKYWASDLRPGVLDDSILSSNDPAPWQHLNFAALALGTEDILNSKSVSATEAQIASGAVKWPTPTGASAPFQPAAGGVDDLWHAAVNGRGRFVNAKTSQELGRGILAILLDLATPRGTDAAAGVGNPNLSPSNNHVYVASFDGSTGTVKKIQFDPTTLAAASNVVVWDAATALNAQLTPTVSVPTPWFTNRRVVTMNSPAKVPFVYGSLSATQLNTLGPDSTTQQATIEYLRGNKALEGTDEGQLRVRTSLLGDIVNSAPRAVGKPDWPYEEVNDPGYTAFKSTYSGRSTRIYVGGNDGMLHVLNDTDGSEAWAYIPSELFRGAPNDKEGLVGLTYQVGGLPFYEHRYYVNATPRIVDVDAGGWKTMLVGGLGKGGRSYFALDITDPALVTNEATAVSKVMWEFRDPSGDSGYSYGRANLIKTRAFGGRWVAILPAGYNNPSGLGKIFIVDAANGQWLKTMSTGVGSAANPAGLAHVSTYVQDARNQLVEQLYAGDLLGNLWRFDLSSADDTAWTVQKMAELRDALGNPQPVTTEPAVGIDTYTGIDRWVFVGTGKLLHKSDLTATPQAHTLYAFRDGSQLAPGPITTPLTRADLDVVSSGAGLGTGVIAVKGWYDDLTPGYRVVTNPVAMVGVAGYVATGPATDPCKIGQPAEVFVRQFGNGESLLKQSGAPVESIPVAEGGASIDIVAIHKPGCISNCVELRAVIGIKGVPGVEGPLRSFELKPHLKGDQHRINWITLGQ